MTEKSITLQLPAGTSVVLTVPVDLETGHGFFPRKNTARVLGKDREVLNGFVVENEDVGTIENEPIDSLSVKYSHKKPSENKIHFFAITGEKTTIYIINTPIHDHSSVVQGGPAFGTYYVDEEEQQ